jgi:hypothetical protein
LSRGHSAALPKDHRCPQRTTISLELEADLIPKV